MSLWTVYETGIINKCGVVYICDSALGRKKYAGNTRYAFSPCIHHRTKSEGPVHWTSLSRANWYNIGLELGIPYTTLDCFKQNDTDQLVLLREVMKHWLKTVVDPRPTWETVVTALRSPLVNEKDVAKQLESKYCAPVQEESSCFIKVKSEGM